MVKLDIEGERAVRLLSEGDPTMAAELLNGDGEIGRELRETLAVMLVGYSLQGVTLTVKEKSGGIKQSTFDRDWNLYKTIENLREKTSCSIENACLDLSETEKLGDVAIKKIYQRMSRSHDEYLKLCREG